MVFDVSKLLHQAMSCVDLSGYSAGASAAHATAAGGAGGADSHPRCQHGRTRMVTVKKEGKNKGRMFYVCAQQRGAQCNFFQWADQSHGSTAAAAGGGGGGGSTSASNGLAAASATIKPATPQVWSNVCRSLGMHARTQTHRHLFWSE